MYYEDMMIITGEEAGQYFDHDFYEKIEAPKFVDFTTPERCHPDHDDRYWFCMRVGCDRKHEEEIDPKEIDKNFVLRVMAARSPSVRFRRAIDSKTLSSKPKCPKTVPPKSSIARESRFETLSSISRKMAKAKGTTTTTPNDKSNPRPLSQSVKKPKPLDLAPKSNVVAKALIFHSPNKAMRLKPPSVASKPQKRAVGEVQTRGFDSGHREKSLRCELGIREDVYDECSDMEIDGDSRKGSMDLHCKSNVEGNSIEAFEFCDSGDDALASNDQEKRDGDEVTEIGDDKENSPSPYHKEEDEKIIESIDDKENISSLNNDKEKGEEVMDSTDDKENALGKNSSFPNVEEKCDKVVESTYDKENADQEKHDEDEVMESINDKENASSHDDKEKHDQVMEGDDKENASVLDDNTNRVKDGRRLNQGSEESKILGKLHKNSKCIQKAMEVSGKTMKETGFAQVVKYGKPKPTNPKPFRLRTNERQILKEAKMSKKLNVVKEVTITTRRTKVDLPQQCENNKELKSIKRKDRDQDQHRKKASLVDLQQRQKQVKDVAKRTKSPLSKQPPRPQWVSSTREEKPSLKAATCQRGAIHETSRTMLKHMKAPSKKDALSATKPSPPQLPHYFFMGKCMYQDSNLKHH